MSAIPAVASSKFLVLCFFSIAALLLNHSDWIEENKSDPIEQRFDLSADELARVQFASEPAEELARIAAKKASVRGSFSAGDEVGDEVFARLQGVRGLTDLRVNFKTGVLQVVIEPASLLPHLNESHRAERAGDPWRLVVDIAAIVLLVLSLVGLTLAVARER